MLMVDTIRVIEVMIRKQWDARPHKVMRKFFSFILRDEKSLDSSEQKCNMILCFLKGYSWLCVEESVGKQA